MKNGNGGGRNSSVRQEVLEEAGLPKVYGETDGADWYSKGGL